MGRRRIDRLDAVDKALFAHGKNHRNRARRTFEVVIPLRHESRLERSGSLVIAVIEGVAVFGRRLDDMPMHGWRT